MIKKVLLASSLILLAVAVFGEKIMGVPQYGTNRSVKVCALYKTIGMACGTGLLLGHGKVLTENHIVDRRVFDVVTISSEGFKPLHIDESPYQVVILRQDGQEFQPAIVLSTHSAKDLALLRIEDDVTPAVLFDETFNRGQEVTVIGNPGSADFEVTKTKIMGVYLYRDKDELRNLIMVDSQKNRIRPGYSGGGIFNKNGGLVGILEVCNDEEEMCAGIPASYVKDWLKSIGGLES